MSTSCERYKAKAITSIGRRWGLIQDVTIMFLGLCMLVASWGVTLQGWVICYAWSLFFYGVGLGGEVRGTLIALFPHLPVSRIIYSLDILESR